MSLIAVDRVQNYYQYKDAEAKYYQVGLFLLISKIYIYFFDDEMRCKFKKIIL